MEDLNIRSINLPLVLLPHGLEALDDLRASDPESMRSVCIFHFNRSSCSFLFFALQTKRPHGPSWHPHRHRWWLLLPGTVFFGF